MSDHADLLRRAAKLIRETANAAPRGPYTFKSTPGYHQPIYADDGDVIGTTRPWAGGLHEDVDVGTAEQTGAHIALWHPGVALAVATWLEDVADLHEPHASAYGCDWCSDEDWPCADTRNALAVARALLGKDA